MILFSLNSTRIFLFSLYYQTTFFSSENSFNLSFSLFLKSVRVFCSFHFHHSYWIKLWICLSLSLLMIWRHSKLASESARMSYGFLWRWYRKRHCNVLMLSASLTQPGHLASKWGNLRHCCLFLNLIKTPASFALKHMDL